MMMKKKYVNQSRSLCEYGRQSHWVKMVVVGGLILRECRLYNKILQIVRRVC